MSSPTLEPGGRIPSIGELFSETMAELTANIQGYLMAGLAFMAVVFPLSMMVTLFGMIGLYAVMGFGMMASVMGGAAIGDATGDSDTGGMIAAIGSAGSFVLAFLVFFGFILLMVAALAPVTASLQRAIAAQQRGEGTITFPSAFATIRQDLGATVGVVFLATAAAFLGLMFCYVGVFVPALLFTFALPMVAHHRKGAMEALRTTARHAIAHPGDYAILTLTMFGVNLVAAYVPIVGQMFVMALQVRAYRKMFGDGPEPVL